MSTEFTSFDEADDDASKSIPFKQKIQMKLFLIFNEAMRERNLKFYVAIVIVPLMFLQMIGYIYDPQIAFPFLDSLYPIVSNLIGYLRLIPAIEASHASGAYWLVVYLTIALTIIIFLLMVYVDYSIKIGKFVMSFPLSALIVLFIVFYWILLTPSVEAFIGIFLCFGGVHSITGIACWSAVHIIYCIICIISVVGFLLVIAIIAFYNNESRIDNLDIMRRTDMNLELLLAIYRVLIAIVSPFCRSSNLQWVLIIIYLIGSIVLVRNYFMYIPFHDEKMSILYGTGVVSYLWVCFNAFLLKILQGINYSGQTVVIIIGLVVIYPLVSSIRDKIIYNKIFNCRHDKVKSEYELDIYMKKLSEMSSAQQLSEVDEMILLGYVTNHKSECANPECPLNSSKEFYLPSLQKSTTASKAGIKDPIILTHLLSSIYSEYSQRANTSATVHIIYSYFLFYKVGNVHNALIELSLALKCDISVQQRFSIFRMKKVIEEFLSDIKKKDKNMDKEIRNLDVNLVIVFEGMLQEFQKAIEKSSNEHIEFWAHLDTLLPDLNHLHKLGLNIIQFSKKAHDIWSKLIKINPSYPAALRIYGIYMRDIKNDEEIGIKLLDKEKSIRNALNSQENLNDFELMFAESTAIIVISGAKDTQGKITKSNTGVSKIFGYKQTELIGHDASIIMPPIIGSKHNSFLSRYFSSGKEVILNREKITFAVDRVHYLMPICLIVKPLSCVDEDISYIALIRSINKNFDYILCDNDGKIDSLTKRITDSCGLNGNNMFFQENEVYLHLMFPDLMTKVKVHEGDMITRFDALTSGDSMKIPMCIPRDYIHSVQQLNKFEKEDTKDATPTPYEKQNTKVKTPNYLRFEESLKFHSKIIDNSNLLKNFIDYKTSDYFEKVKLTLLEEELGEGIVKVKIFKITHESKAEQGSSKDSEEDISESPQTHNKSNELIKKGTKMNDDSILDDSMLSSKDKAKENVINIENPTYQSKTPDQKSLQSKKTNKEDSSADPLAAKLDPDKHSPNEEESKQSFVAEMQTKKKTKKEDELLDVDDVFLIANAKKAEKKKENKIIEDDINKLKNEKEKKFQNDEVGSMISNTKDTLKKIKQLRAAMYEKYEPTSVKQLKILSQVVFIILVGMTLSFYFIQSNLMNSCQSSINSIYNSKDRVKSISAIGYSVRMLSYMNNIDIALRKHFGLIYYNDTNMDYYNWTNRNINKFATLLKDSQNNLSTTPAIITSQVSKDINPNEVNIYFPNADKDIPTNVSIDCWSSIMSLVIHAHNAEVMDHSAYLNPLYYPESVQYIMSNSMDTILFSIREATDSILTEIHYSLNFNDNIFKTLLSVASTALIVSITILFPVAYKVARNKGHLLSLFMDINPKAVRTQLRKCRNSFSFIRIEGDKQQSDELEEDEEEKKEEKKEDIDPLVDSGKRKMHKSKSSKNYKKYNTKFFQTVIKFIIFICFLESYFIFAYFTSNSFFTRIGNISNEVCLLAKRAYSNSLLFRAEMEMIGDKSSTYILQNNSQVFVFSFTELLIQQQEDFLRVHSENIQYNDEYYNSQFDKIVYNSVCEELYLNSTSCNQFMGGILQKGLHSCNVAFWDNMREMYNSYIVLNKSLLNTSIYFNDNKLIENEFLESQYLSTAYESLQQTLNSSIEAKFQSEKSIAMTVFLAYICLMVLVYYVYWRLFLESTRGSLSVTKSMLSIIPLEVVENVRSINSFLKNTSITNLG